MKFLSNWMYSGSEAADVSTDQGSPSPQEGERGPGGEGVVPHKRLAWLLTLPLLALLLASCSRVSQPADPAPALLPATLPSLALSWQSDTAYALNLDTLVHDKTQPFTVTFSAPAHGQVRVEQGLLVYTSTQPGWRRDSCAYTLTQAGASGTGRLVFVNIGFRDTSVTPAGADSVLLPAQYRLTALLSGFDVQVIPQDSTGTLISWSAEHYDLQQTGPNVLTYTAAGGTASDTNFGYDVIRYRWQSATRRYIGTVQVGVGDTSDAAARPLLVAASGGTAFITQAQLKVRAKGSGNRQATGAFTLDLANSTQRATRYGTVQVATQGGDPGFSYTRTQPGTQPDSIPFYYKHDLDDRITRSYILVTF